MKILIIEDDEFDYMFLKRNLERAFRDEPLHIEWIKEPRSEYLKEIVDEFDVCFVDNGLQSETGTELIQALNESGTQTPMILLTGDLRPELDQNALEAGASDFLHKDKLSISSVFRLTRHCITRKDQERRLREMAYTDPLTSLANRAAFDERCKAALSRVMTSNRTFSLVVLDLDDFKTVNDTYGHPIGDALLRQFSAELRTHFGKNDMVARLGGDEFAVLMETDEAPPNPSDIRKVLRSSMKTEFDILDLNVSAKASIGVAVVDANQPSLTVTDILHRADRNLYSDKRRRKFAQSHGYDSDGFAEFDLDKTVQDLEKAISRKELELFYQPKVNFKSGKITGLEALLRWNNSGHCLGPSIFIPVAEEYGLINEIGAWVLRQSCAQLKEWTERECFVPSLAINVSPLQLDNVNFYDLVKVTLAEFGISPDRIEFELTERTFDQGTEARVEQMKRIAKLGCRWAIDDFGIGYSSLSRLHKLPISKIKIDKSFLSQLPDDAAARDISNTIILMARNLNLDVVAEGLEDPKQLTGLHLADTDELQGYHCFRPMNATRVGAILRDRALVAA